MDNQKNITDTDLQMYSAGLLSPIKSLYMGWLIFISKDLKTRLQVIEKDNMEFVQNEGVTLGKKLFPFSKTHQSENSEQSLRFDLPAGGRGLKFGGALVAVALAAGLFIIGNQSDSKIELAEFTAKGRSLGMNLYVKGEKNFLVENYLQAISRADTLQLLPVGEDEQYLMLYSWEPAAGFSRIFPFEGDLAGPVSRMSFPPSLQLSSGAENKLICISSTGPFDVTRAGEIFKMEKLQNLSAAPSSLLLDDMYIQIYTLTSEAL